MDFLFCAGKKWNDSSKGNNRNCDCGITVEKT